MARILVAEDDADVRDFVHRGLKLQGHDVMSVHDGGEAAHIIFSGNHEFDLLLTDIRMPVMDGIALALKVAQDKPDLPVLLMTGYADQRERAHGLEVLIKGVVQKPFSLAQIVKAVEDALS